MNSHDGIRRAAKHNSDYRRVLATGKHSQLVLMSIPPEGEIGTKTHPDIDQVRGTEKLPAPAKRRCEEEPA